MKPQINIFVLLKCFLLSPSLWGQLSIFGDIYVSEENQLHIAFEDTYFNGGKIITEKKSITEGVVSFGSRSKMIPQQPTIINVYFLTKVKLLLGLEWHKVTNGMKRNEAPSLSLWEEIQLLQDTKQQPLDQVPNPMHGTPPLWAEELLRSAELRLLSEATTTYTPAGGTNLWNPSDRLFVIGNGTGSSTASRTNALVIFKDGTATTSGNCTGPGFNVLSDQRLKTDVRSLKSNKEKILALNPIEFRYKSDPQIPHYGFLAQEVEKIFPELVYQTTGSDSMKSIDYFGFIPLLIQVLKHQQQELNQLKKKITD